MSKGGWARLRKQQQQSTQSQSGDDDTCQVQYKCSQQQQIIAAHPHAHMHHNTTLTTSTISPASSPSTACSLTAFSPPLRDPMSPLNQGTIRTSKLLQIVRRWKALSAKQISSRSHRSSTSSTSCSRLNLVPLSCISFSSFQSYSDHEEEHEDDDVGNDADITSESSLKSAKSPTSPPLHYKLRSAQAAKPQSMSCRPSMKTTQCTGKDSHSSCERKIRALARCALSCPQLRSPLSSCTASPNRKYGDAQEEEELESLQPKKEEAGDSVKLRRSSSSPLRRRNVSKQPSTPKGYLALYVGEERKRFVVKANLVNHPLFSVLLEKAKEEFGFDQKGPLNIPCDIAFFQHIMFLVESNHKSSF